MIPLDRYILLQVVVVVEGLEGQVEM